MVISTITKGRGKPITQPEEKSKQTFCNSYFALKKNKTKQKQNIHSMYCQRLKIFLFSYPFSSQ